MSRNDQRSKQRSHASREAADIANVVEPRAESAYYDQSRDRVVINLKSGATFSFPPALAQGLVGASPEDLAEVEVTPSGDGLHWEKLDKEKFRQIETLETRNRTFIIWVL